MATQISANLSLAVASTFGAFCWNLIDELKTTQSWTQSGSADGVTYDNAGTGPVTGGGTGVGGLEDNGAWVRLSKTISSVVYEIVFLSSGGANGSIWVSVGSAFTSGSPSATQRPEATNERAVLGSGTAGAPSAEQFVTGNAAIQHIVLNDASPFGFVSWAYDNGTRNACGFFCMDPITQSAGATAPGSPYVFGADLDYVTDISAFTNLSNGPFSHRRRYGLSGVSWELVAPMTYNQSSGVVFPKNAGNSPCDSTKVDVLDVDYGGVSLGRIGRSTLFQYPGSNHGNSTLYSTTTTGDRIVMGLVVVPWDNTVPT